MSKIEDQIKSGLQTRFLTGPQEIYEQRLRDLAAVYPSHVRAFAASPEFKKDGFDGTLFRSLSNTGLSIGLTEEQVREHVQIVAKVFKLEDTKRERAARLARLQEAKAAVKAAEEEVAKAESLANACSQKLANDDTRQAELLRNEHAALFAEPPQPSEQT